MSDGVSLLPSGSRESYRHRKKMSAKGQLAEIGRPLGDTFSFEDISYHRWAESIHSSVVVSRNQKVRPYSRSEVIHRAGDKSLFFEAFERERPRIVNIFAASAPPGYELSSFLAR
jgi:hypothetical protein